MTTGQRNQNHNIMRTFSLTFACISLAFASLAQPAAYKTETTRIHIKLSDLHSGVADLNRGNLFPIDEHRSLLNAAASLLCIVNNKTGAIEKRFDEAKFKEKLAPILTEHFGGKYTLPSKDAYEDMPFCEKYPIRYERFFKMEEDGSYACQISCSIQSIENPEQYESIQTLGFYDEDLNIKELLFVEQNDTGLTLLLTGGFFKGKDTFWARKIAPFQGASDFVRYHNATGRKYENQGEETAIPMSSLAVYTPARFFSAFQLGDEYYVNIGTELVRTKDFTGPVERLPFPLEADECVDIFEKVHDNRFVGLNSKLDGEGASRTGTLFETDAGFKYFLPIKQYDFLRYTLRSIEVLDGTVYILLFDREQYCFLLERITLPPLGQPLLGR